MFSVFKNINKFAGKWKVLDYTAIFFARFFPYLMVVFLFGLSVETKYWKILFYPLISALFSRFLISSLIYFFYKEPRPANLTGTKTLIPVPSNPSFPSSHAAVFSAISFALFFFNINLAIIFLVLSVIMGVARVFCGVHWFHDIVGGFISGFISSVAIYYLLNFIIK